MTILKVQLVKNKVDCDRTMGHYVHWILTEGEYVTLHCACGCMFQLAFPPYSTQDTYLKHLEMICNRFGIDMLYPDQFGQSAVKRLYLEGRSNEKIRNSLPSYNTVEKVELSEATLAHWEKGRLKIAIMDIVKYPPPLFSKYKNVEDVIAKSIKWIMAAKMLEAN